MFIDLLSYLTSLIKDINFNVNFINVDSVLPSTLFNTKKSDTKDPNMNESNNKNNNTNAATNTTAANNNNNTPSHNNNSNAANNANNA